MLLRVGLEGFFFGAGLDHLAHNLGYHLNVVLPRHRYQAALGLGVLAFGFGINWDYDTLVVGVVGGGVILTAAALADQVGLTDEENGLFVARPMGKLKIGKFGGSYYRTETRAGV